jgi:predicted glycosyltransferase
MSQSQLEHVSTLRGVDTRPLRIALYSHDTMGLGHTRRNLLIAGALAESTHRPTTLLISGASAMQAFRLPPRCDLISLPGMRKERNGGYAVASLDIALPRLTFLRAHAIRAAIEAFDPEVFIVDKVPRGPFRELQPTLEHLRKRGARCVLGLRDILDDPAVVRREWEREENHAAIRDFYDAIWIYGDPRIYDAVRAYGFPDDLAARARYVGYLDPSLHPDDDHLDDGHHRGSDPPDALPPGRIALCYVGGGQDGARLAEAFAGAELPADTHGIILTGPFMPRPARERLHRAAADRSQLRVIEFLSRPGTLLRRADRIVAMGGYNTTCEILALAKRALLVPRTHPRREQLIRVERLAELGLVDALLPQHLTPTRLSQWLATNGANPAGVGRIDLAGLSRLPRLVEELMAPSREETLSLAGSEVADAPIGVAARLLA